jgi:hypothetical protein
VLDFPPPSALVREVQFEAVSRANLRPGEQAIRFMVTPSNSRVTSSRRTKALTVLLAGGILFAIGFGGPAALLGASAGATFEVASRS